MTSDANGWPDKPGVPMNPERDGWHWVQQDGRKSLCAKWMWGSRSIGKWISADVRGNWRYLAPCLTPFEIEHRERAASAAAWIAAREAGAKIVHDMIPSASPPQTDHYGAHVAGERYVAERAEQRIRALPPPADAMAALAEVVRVAVERERESIAADFDSERLMIHGAYVAQLIRARSKERGA
jgi:hypothetical protein